MAILKGIISKMNGSAGNLTFKQTGGQTVVSEKVTQTTDARTELQQKQRMKWANVIRMYQVLRPYMKLAFGGSQNGRSDYNKFVSVNLALQPVYLTKAEVNAGACVVAPYKITQGKLKSISVAGKASEAVTNISLGTLTITADTTVAEFSNAVVQHNKFFEYGDQITYFLVSQEINEVTSTPMADVDACCIVLDKNKDTKLLSLVDSRGFASRDGYLAAQADADFGNHGMVWIHSRKNVSDGTTMVSAQFLVCDNALLAQYQGQDAYDTAVNSYGGANTFYLTPSGTLKPAAGSDSDGTGGSNPSDSGSDTGGSGKPSDSGSGSDSGGGGTGDEDVYE